MSDGMRRELAYLSSHATNRYFIPNWGISIHPLNSAKLEIAGMVMRSFLPGKPLIITLVT